MIRRVEVIFRKTGVWARGSTFSVVPIVALKDGQVLLTKDYPKGTTTVDIWDEMRAKMTDFFFDIFYPAVIWQTSAPEPPSRIPDVALSNQSKHIQKKQTRLPEFYEWNPEFGKWHMTEEGYRTRTEPMDIGVSETPEESMYNEPLLRSLQEKYKGETRSIILFVYPDKYDQEVRALFELRITFW